MKYIVHHNIEQKISNGKIIKYPIGTQVECINNMLVTPIGEFICYNTSQIGHMYFSRDDDACGLERGKITYAIAYAPRYRMNTMGTRAQRFTDEEIELLCTKWKQFLRTDLEMILFNNNFFNANIFSLREMAKDLNIKEADYV